MMIPVLLAGAFRIGEENAIRGLIPSGSSVTQILIYGGALLVVALAIFGWAIYHTQHGRRRSHHHSKPSVKSRRRHEHYTRNPTLAETGGLPPVRPDN
jgi:hypothetical protein